jgi:hypothetical protein
MGRDIFGVKPAMLALANLILDIANYRHGTPNGAFRFPALSCK